MKMYTQITMALVATFFVFQANATDNVAKVIIMRGMVKAKLADGTLIDVKADQSIPEGATVQTADKSFVKLLFIDKSQMNLGPNSQMVINAFPKSEAGIITLVKGQIRSQVTKDYMEMDDKNKSKLYIKTKTAAMGIRGTDFQVNFNAENQNTSLITFEGKVAMAHIEKGMRGDNLDQQILERVVSSEKAVMVTQGQISAVNLNVTERAMTPTKLGTQQIEALEKNETGIKEMSPSEENTKQYRNPIPPGADGVTFSNNAIVDEDRTEKSTNADGFYNVATGEYKLPAGSIIDLNTVNIIPPPANSVFDANSGTYIVPESLGKIDKTTGEYKSPIGLQLGSDGKFIMVDPEAYTKSQAVKAIDEEQTEKKADDKAEKKEGAVEGERAPSSIAPPVAEAPPKAPEIFTGGAAQAFITTFATPTKPVNAGPPAGALKDNLANLANEILKQNDVLKQTATERGVTTPKTKVKFIFNAR